MLWPRPPRVAEDHRRPSRHHRRRPLLTIRPHQGPRLRPFASSSMAHVRQQLDPPRCRKRTYRFEVHAAGHATHATHAGHSTHSWHSTHTTHTSHSGHSTHATHATHAAHVKVVILDRLALLLILIDPFAEIGLDVLGLDLLLLQTGPVLCLLLLLAKDEGKVPAREALLRALRVDFLEELELELVVFYFRPIDV